MLFFCVTLNSLLIGYFLLSPLTRHLRRFITSFKRAAGYLGRPLSERQEQALRQRTLVLLAQLAGLMLALLLIGIGYAPSLWLAAYQGDIADALVSVPATLGLLTAGVLIWLLQRRRRSA